MKLLSCIYLTIRKKLNEYYFPFFILFLNSKTLAFALFFAEMLRGDENQERHCWRIIFSAFIISELIDTFRTIWKKCFGDENQEDTAGKYDFRAEFIAFWSRPQVGPKCKCKCWWMLLLLVHKPSTENLKSATTGDNASSKYDRRHTLWPFHPSSRFVQHGSIYLNDVLFGMQMFTVVNI